METAWGWAGADTGAETTNIGIVECFHFPFSHSHSHIHEFTRRDSGADATSKKPGRRSDTHREVQGPRGLETELLADMLCAGGG